MLTTRWGEQWELDADGAKDVLKEVVAFYGDFEGQVYTNEEVLASLKLLTEGRDE